MPPRRRRLHRSGSERLFDHLLCLGLLAGADASLGGLAAVSEAVGLVARLDDVAVVREPIQERGGHLRIAEHAGPFAEHEVGGDDDAGVLVEFRQQMEQQRAAALRERQVAKLVKDHDVEIHQVVREASGAAGGLLLLQRVDEFDRGVEAHALAVAGDRFHTERRGEVRLAGAGTADEHYVLRLLGECG